jgi:hypothetical protein
MKSTIPTVKVWGLPGNTDPEKKREIFLAILGTLSGFPKTKVKKSEDIFFTWRDRKKDDSLFSDDSMEVEISRLPFFFPVSELRWMMKIVGSRVQNQFSELPRLEIICTGRKKSFSKSVWKSGC